jgi:hypothetical protein
MPSSGILRLMVLVRTDASEEYIASFVRVLRLLVTDNVVSSLPILDTVTIERYIPPKRRFLQDSHGVTSQKTSFFVVTAVIASNFHSWKHSWKQFFDTPVSDLVAFALTPSAIANRCPYVQGIWRMLDKALYLNTKDRCAAVLLCTRNRPFAPTLRTFSSQCIPEATENLVVHVFVYSTPSWNRLPVDETLSIAHSADRHWHCTAAFMPPAVLRLSLPHNSALFRHS